MTLSKLAKLAHVSVSTASKAFSMSDEVSAETREAVFAIARENGCFKQFFNAKYPRLVIAVICPEVQGRFYSKYITSLKRSFSEFNCEICVATSDFSGTELQNLLNYYSYYTSVDGVVLISGEGINTEEYELPVVCITDSPNNVHDITVNPENAVISMLESIKENGATEIGYIGEKRTNNKLKRLEDACRQLDFDFRKDAVAVTDLRFEEGGYAAMESLYKKGCVPQYLLAAYDYMAIGAIRCILDHKQSVPEDVAVIGMDNIDECDYLNPPLASIGPDSDLIAKSVCENLLGLILGKPYKRNVCIPYKFYNRQSAKKCP